MGAALLVLCWPQSVRADDGAARVSLALRQATLIHSMRAATCFAMAGIDAGQQGALALEHADTYGTTLGALRDGHDWLGLAPTEDPDTIAAIAASEAVWRGFRPAIDQIIAGDLHSVVMRQIMRDTDATVESATTMAAHFLDSAAPPDRSVAVRQAAELAAHHRMLTQRALGEMCYVLFDLGGAAMPSRLERTLDEIAHSYAVLSAGSDTVAAPPSARIARNLRTAHLFWSKMRPTIEAARSDTPPDALTVQKMLKLNRSVLKQLNQAIDGYIG
ncbi:MAG: hypothetical protein AAGK30_03175 [Pseudomonadota bacterium]